MTRGLLPQFGSRFPDHGEAQRFGWLGGARVDDGMCEFNKRAATRGSSHRMLRPHIYADQSETL